MFPPHEPCQPPFHPLPALDGLTLARIGAEATLTVLYDEGADHERIVRQRVGFMKPAAIRRRFRVAPGGVTEET